MHFSLQSLYFSNYLLNNLLEPKGFAKKLSSYRMNSIFRIKILQKPDFWNKKMKKKKTILV